MPCTVPSASTSRETSTIIPPGRVRRKARKCGRMRDKMNPAAAWRKPCDRKGRTRTAPTSSFRILSIHCMTKNVLVVDIGGSHIKVRASGRRTEIKVDSGPDLTPRQMVDRVLGATDGWEYDVVSVGYPGPVVNGRIAREPVNLGRGWTRFDFERAFGC